MMLLQRHASHCHALCLLAALAISACVPTGYPSWPFAHSNSVNSGIVFVTTAPAAAGSISVPNIGTFAAGAGPVAASDGTVYIGNLEGHLMAFRENGASVWNVMVSGGEPIVGSPLIWNGAIFVTAATTTSAALYKFRADGSEVFRTLFPVHRDLIETTSPTVIRVSEDIIVMPATYRLRAAPVYETRLIGITSEFGQVRLDLPINVFTPSATVDDTGIPGELDNPPLKQRPLPMAASYTELASGQARLVVADGYQAVVAFKVIGASIVEAARFEDESEFRSFTSTPTVMYDPSAGRYRGFLVNSAKGLMWADDPLSTTSQYTTPNTHTASSVTVTTWGNLAVWNNELIVLRAGSTDRIPIAGNSIASVAASRNYFYVSSVDAFTTFDIVLRQQVARFDWVGGGLHPPVIGPNGHVYAIASNILFIFPPPRTTAMTTGRSQVEMAVGAQAKNECKVFDSIECEM